MTAAIPTIDYGTINRDRQGRFVKTYTLSYGTYVKGTDKVVKLVRHLPADGIERIGEAISKAAKRGIAWDIQVLDSDGVDVTFDFACLRD
ncbi:hypothetical protein [Nonomuraea sp. NPDC046570]|uniref:hypothetical protein n=1 Tax=Nonomuraea sp. NPDC046570 TaxID=3155255 RepID=UPI0033F9ADF8